MPQETVKRPDELPVQAGVSGYTLGVGGGAGVSGNSTPLKADGSSNPLKADAASVPKKVA